MNSSMKALDHSSLSMIITLNRVTRHAPYIHLQCPGLYLYYLPF
jgi:hypothetical protein